MDPLETVYACSTAAYSTTYSCNRAFDSSPSSYFYTRYSTTALTLTNKLEKYSPPPPSTSLGACSSPPTA